MLKKIYLFVIPCCLIVSEADACSPHGQANFYNDTSKRLNIKVKRVRVSDMICFTKLARQWSEAEKEKCSKKMVFSYQDITVLPGGNVMDVCWLGKDQLAMVDFNVKYKDHGVMHAGPKGEIIEYMESSDHSDIFVTMLRRGDQRTIKFLDCNFRFSGTCDIRFSSVQQEKNSARSMLKNL